MSDEFKILPGQVTQLTTRDERTPAEREADSRRLTRRFRPEEIAAHKGNCKTTVSKGGGPVETCLEVPPDFSDWMTPRGICQQCGERTATVVWAPDGTMGAIHGGYQYWCNRCALREQVAHARECANKLPGLERQLREEER
jgi:hypothetical protein